MSICTSNIVNSICEDRAEYRRADQTALILIIDRNATPMLAMLRNGSFAGEYRFETASAGADALECILNDPPSAIILDPQLSDQSGLELHAQIRRIAPQIPVIFASKNRTADAAIEAMKQGAHDYLFKPIEERQLHRVVTEALEISLQKRGSEVGPSIPWASDVDGALCGGCPMMREVYKSIGVVAGKNVNVLITGESGTGKELVARAVHRHSSRAQAPFLALNCAAIPENLLESELFGHEKGAFSGAERRRIGKFEQYNGGTILLDEIGDMPLALQAKILRLLQEQTFERIGGNETIQTNVRLIASTHRDLKTWSAEGRFRADLYYRLSVFTIHLPPLRERGEDLPMLVQYFLRKYSRELGKEIHAIAPEALKRLQNHRWPGNIRELQSILRQALLRSSGHVLLPAFLPLLDDTSPETAPRQPLAVDFDIDEFLRRRLTPDACDLYADLHRELDRHSLARVLIYTRGNRHMASRVLGIARQTLRLKLRESGLQNIRFRSRGWHRNLGHCNPALERRHERQHLAKRQQRHRRLWRRRHSRHRHARDRHFRRWNHV
jgi:DNA-binding NtrC family response regulator